MQTNQRNTYYKKLVSLICGQNTLVAPLIETVGGDYGFSDR